MYQQTETHENIETAQVKSKRRVSKIIRELNKLSRKKYNKSILFSFASGKPKTKKFNRLKNVELNRLHGGGIGTAMRVVYKKKKTIVIFVRAAKTRSVFGGGTLTTEIKEERETAYGILEDTVVMPVLIDENEKPKRYSLFTFEDLRKIRCIEYRNDRETFVRAKLDRVMESLTPFYGRENKTGLLFDSGSLDATGAIIEFMKKNEHKLVNVKLGLEMSYEA